MRGNQVDEGSVADSTEVELQILREEEDTEEKEEGARIKRKKRKSPEAPMVTGRARAILRGKHLPSASIITTGREGEEDEDGNHRALTAWASASAKKKTRQTDLLHDIAVALQPPAKSAEEIEMERRRLDFHIEIGRQCMQLVELVTRALVSYLAGEPKKTEEEYNMMPLISECSIARP